ncbi:MAG: conjugal transfer protein TraO [Bacteroidota bacterium]|nr:conjugal transfer protein TraO [Bacteroidota bacterium]
MKHYHLCFGVLLVLLIFPNQKTFAQRGNLSLGLVPTYKTDGYGLQLNVNHYHSTTDFIQVSLAATSSKEKPDAGVEFPYEDYLLGIGYFTTILTSPSRGVFFYFGGAHQLGISI